MTRTVFHAMAAEAGLAGAAMDLVLDLPGGQRWAIVIKRSFVVYGTAELAAALRSL
jgi:hypothetical protein